MEFETAQVPGAPIALLPQECRITQVENGFVLKFGCKTFVAKTWGEASIGLGKYWEDPYAAQKEYTKKGGD